MNASEKFPCNLCNKSFTRIGKRSFDMETVPKKFDPFKTEINLSFYEKLKSIFRFMKRLSFLEQSSFQIVTLAQRLYEKAQRNCSRQSSTLPMLLLRQGLRREERFREPRQRHPLEGEVLRVSHLSQELQILQQPISSPENPTRKRRDCSDSQAG